MQRQVFESAQLSRFPQSVGVEQSYQRALIVEEAITWKDTPFLHQGRTKGAGCDCIGLVIGVARRFGFDKAARFTEYKAYSRNPDGHTMARIMSQYLVKIQLRDAKPGDILHFSFIQFPQHVAMLLFDNWIIHAHEPDGRVVSHQLAGWWLSRVMGAYQFKGLV